LVSGRRVLVLFDAVGFCNVSGKVEFVGLGSVVVNDVLVLLDRVGVGIL
jgi:hypothetical protein